MDRPGRRCWVIPRRSLRSWQTSRRAIPLDRSIVVGILNITPDSFSDGGRNYSAADALRSAFQMKEDGADIIDVGGESTRPGAEMPDEQEEIGRVVPVIERIAAELEVPVSVDTRRAAVARAALAAGAEIVNDVSGLQFDPDMGEVVAKSGAGIIIMHMRGTPATMDSMAIYENVVDEVAAELVQACGRAVMSDVPPERIVVDPGLGFAKTAGHNLALVANLERITRLGYPVLIGPSRKRFLGTITGKAVNERDPATAAACVAARMKGATLFRVHDVGIVREALQVADAVLSSSPLTADRSP